MEFIAQLHPLVVHFPIAFIILYVFMEIINVFFKSQQIRKFSILILFLGVIGGILAVLTGNQSFQILEDNSLLTRLHYASIEKHEFYASITLWYFFAVLIFKTYAFQKKKNEALLRYIFIIFAVAGVFLLYKTASLGGILVYEYGIGTNLLK